LLAERRTEGWAPAAAASTGTGTQRGVLPPAAPLTAAGFTPSLFPAGHSPAPLVKICGLTRPEDVELAWTLGAWAIGFVFAPSPRRLTPAAARALVEHALGAAVLESPAAGVPVQAASAPAGIPGWDRPFVVGVFVDVSAAEIAAAVDEAGLDGVQLHGISSLGGDEVRRAVGSRERPLLIIRAVPVDLDATDPELLRTRVAEARAEADVVLLDTRAAGRFGGTGLSFTWSLARHVDDGLPLLVAGGIGPDNVRTALRQSGAWGVDVSSGVEQAPGIKDGVLMERLFAEAGAGRRFAPGGGLTHAHAGTLAVLPSGPPRAAGAPAADPTPAATLAAAAPFTPGVGSTPVPQKGSDR
jgi:phosphoribosylanthranilate isomerase